LAIAVGNELKKLDFTSWSQNKYVQDPYLNPVFSFVKSSTSDAASGLSERGAFEVRSSSLNNKPINDFNYML